VTIKGYLINITKRQYSDQTLLSAPLALFVYSNIENTFMQIVQKGESTFISFTKFV